MTKSVDALIHDLSAGDRRPYAAMQELAGLGEAAITPLVLALRETKKNTVRDRVTTTLARIGSAAVPALTRLYADEFDPKIKAAVVDALGEIADSAALPTLTSALQDPDAKVRRLADYGIKQIQAANPSVDVKPNLARDIDQARKVAAQPMISHQAIPAVSERSWFRRVVSSFIRRWVLGFDYPEEMKQQVGNPFARWIIRPLRKGLSCFLVVMLLVYAVLCVWEGIAWSTQLSPTYGFVIIRVIVVAVLGLISAFTLPFAIGYFLLFAIVNVAILFFPIGVVHGFTLSPEGELHARQSQRHEVLLLSIIGIGFVLVSYGFDLLANDYPGMIIGYLLESSLRMLIMGTGLMLLVARNLYHSVKGQQPIEQPLV